MTDRDIRQRDKTIEALAKNIKNLRIKHDEACTEHMKREKELLHEISVRNRKIKRQGEQLESRDQSIKHLRENRG